MNIIITLDEHNFAPQSNAKTHQTSVLHKKNGGTVEGPLSGGALLGIKIHLVGPFLIQFNVAKQAFPATMRLKGRSYVLQCIALRFHCTQCAQIVQSLVFL